MKSKKRKTKEHRRKRSELERFLDFRKGTEKVREQEKVTLLNQLGISIYKRKMMM